MTSDADRARALERFGYTPRQARFLVLVALHGGYFLRRQYVAYIGGAHGKAAVSFLGAVQEQGHARALPYGRHGRVFHLCARPVFAAIGQEHNRNRRPAEWLAVIRKLMTLDFVLARPEAHFWATEEDKVAFLREAAVAPNIWPARSYAARSAAIPGTTRYFVDKMPWYRSQEDPRVRVAYVDAERTLNGFETFLAQYRRLLAALPSGVTYVSDRVWSGPVQQVFNRMIRGGGSPAAFSTASFLDYCRLRRAIEEDRLAALSIADLQHFRGLRIEFSGCHFDDLYARWLLEGDKAVHGTDTRPDACRSCVLDVHELGFRYDQRPPDLRASRSESRVT